MNEFGMDCPKVSELLDAMPFTLEELEHAIMNQPMLMLKAQRLKLEYTSRRQDAEILLDRLRVDAAAIIRQKAKAAEVKVTEKFIEEQTERNSKVREAVNKYNETLRLEEWGKGIVNCYFERGSQFKNIVQLRGAEAALDSHLARAEFDRLGVDKIREQAKRKFPGAEN